MLARAERRWGGVVDEVAGDGGGDFHRYAYQKKVEQNPIQ